MDIRKIEHYLLASFCMLIVLPILYIYRAADDNTFTSWRWVFTQTGILRVFILLIPALLCAYGLSRLKLSGIRARAGLLALFFASVIPLWQGPEAIIDASRYFVQAKSLKEFGLRYFLDQWGREIHAWTDLPLVPFLYGLVFTGAGEDRIHIQLFNTILFALTAVLTYLTGKKLWDEETGLHAGLLLLGIPYLLTQVPLMLVDVPTMFFLTLSLYTFLQAAETGGPARTSFAALAFCLAVFSKYSTWLMLSVIPVSAVVLGMQNPRKMLARTAAVLLMAGILAVPAIIIRLDLIREQIMLLRTYQWSGLSRWQEGLLSTFFFQTHPFVTVLSLLGLYRAVRERDTRFLIAAWFAALVLVLQIRRIRYIIPLLPLFCLMASYGLQMIRDRSIRRYVSLSIAASSLVIAYGAYLPFLNSTGMSNLRDAGLFLNSLNCDTIEVYALKQQSSSGSTFSAIPLLDYHTDKRLVSVQEWPGHPGGAASRISSLRFTWEAKKPVLYSPAGAAEGCAVAVISSEALEGVPDELAASRPGLLRNAGLFDLRSEIFKYQTSVTVYEKE